MPTKTELVCQVYNSQCWKLGDSTMQLMHILFNIQWRMLRFELLVVVAAAAVAVAVGVTT
jgi:hypothetical protein